MDLSNKPVMRVLCAEPLEGRWLLSGAPPASSSDTPEPVVSVEEPFVEEDEEEDSDQAIAESDLPAAVLATFKAQFSNAEIMEVEREDEEEGLQYGIRAIKEDGQEVDVTFSPEGGIIDTESFIELDEVPQAAKDLARAESGGEITEVSSLPDGTYEVQTTRADGTELEGVMSWTQPPQSTTPPADAPTETTPVSAPTTFADAATTPARTTPPGGPVVDAAPVESTATEQVAQADAAAADDAERRRREDAIEKNAAAKAAMATGIPSDDRTTRALDALAAGAGATVWLPEVAGALIDVLPINFDAIEQSMQDVLRQVGTLGGKMKSGSALTTGATRLAMAATLVAGVKVLLNQSRKSTVTRQALAFGPAGSSWGWVLGTTDPKRRRRRIQSRQSEP